MLAVLWRSYSVSPKANFVKIPCVIKRSDPYLPPCKTFKYGLQGRLVHVIKINQDFSGFDTAYDAYPVPLVIPWGAVCSLLCNGHSRFVIHEKNAVGMQVRLFTQMHIIKIGRILKSEEET